MCGVTLRDKKWTADLMECLGVAGVEEVLSHGRLRWYGHVEHTDSRDWVSTCRKLQIEGTKDKGRGRNKLTEWVKVGMKRLGLFKEDAQDR